MAHHRNARERQGWRRYASPRYVVWHDSPEWSEERRDYPMASPLKHKDGRLALGDAPGSGVVLDEDRLKATRVYFTGQLRGGAPSA